MDHDRRQLLRLGAISAGAALAGCAGLVEGDGAPADDDEDDPERIDDWQYDPAERTDGLNASGGGAFQTTAGSATESADLGFAAGGASNVADFRRNIEEGYLPVPESLPYEGLFYNYYFDTGGSGECSSLFCPSYATAIMEDPLGDATDRYFTVGLNSTLSTESFERKRLDVVIVLDISGSMSSEFDQYYYDRFGNKHTVEEDDSRSKMAVARDALVALTEQLEPEDRLGIVLFNNEASVAKPLRKVEATDMEAIRGHVREDIRAGGGTNIADGMSEAADMLGEYADADPTEVETRQIVVTDAMPNLGQTDDEALQDRLSGYATDGIHTSFVGIGVDFNPKLVDQITAVRGANYRSVHSAEDFESYLGEEFEYMVTPLVYDLSVELDASDAEIETVYGSTAAEDATDDLLEVNTLFPSPTADGETRGGVVLVKLDGQADGGELTLRASWEDRSGSTDETTTTVDFPAASPEHFDNTGIRKAVLLARYADLLKNWMVHEREPERIDVRVEDGIDVPPGDRPLGEWEQQSQPLSVSAPYESRLTTFKDYFRQEADRIGDDSLDREAETIEEILTSA
ncbi:vWA domain-containing protein [Halorhabdus amylolytica]|uniref:vWA domain-containing protein n=1 Tax=Halorhabdus amylolytica TaxID=2559573 RepID=UPI0010AB0B9C|nr:VWA domain-containing protein [Halorhabdus amylolytica]